MANSFEQMESLIPVPESSRKMQAVSMGTKLLETKRGLRKVLPEEQYVENLEKIIVRDYFPELPKLKAQSEYLEAIAKNDYVKVRELQIRYGTTRRRTDRRTSPSARPSSPSVFDPESPGPSSRQDDDIKRDESPYANREGDNDALLKKKRKKALDDHNVQTYLDCYTSEDNAAFEELAQLHNKRERVRNAWMYAAEARHNAELVYRGAPPLGISNGDADKQLVAIRNGEVEKPAALDNWTYCARNTVLFNAIDEAPLTIAELTERAKQNEKVINKEATRFTPDHTQKPKEALMAQVALQQAAAHIGQVDITGKELGTLNRAALDLIATPSPAPGVDDSPLMTWGEIEGTPFRLDAPDIMPALEDAPVFKIPDVPVRERVAHEMAEHIARRYHGKRKAAVQQLQKMAPKTPSFNSARSSGKLAIMSPAARRFATDKLGIRVNTDKLMKFSPASGFSSGQKTPTSSRALFSPALYNMVKVKKEPGTPVSKRISAKMSSRETSSSITDNLFNLPPSPLPSTSTFISEKNEDPFIRSVSNSSTNSSSLSSGVTNNGSAEKQDGSMRPSASDFF